MVYSEYIKIPETNMSNLEAAKAYDQATTRKEKAEILATVFCIPQNAAMQWVAALHNASFKRLLRSVEFDILDGEYSAKKAMENMCRVSNSGSEESDAERLPAACALYAYQTPALFLRTQAFLVALERNGHDSFALFMDTTAQVETVYAMQIYGWKVDRVELVNKYFGDGGDTDVFKEAAFIIRKQQ